jgi:hypothetical protein
MKKAFLVCVVAAGVGVGCGEDATGTGGTGGTVIGPLTWTVSDYTVVVDAEDEGGCEAVSPTEPLNEFELTIDGSTATLESVELILGGTSEDYSPEDDTVIFTDSFEDGLDDCVVDALDTFTVELDDPNVSLDQNTTVQVTWDHEESDASATPGACDGVWFVALPCASQATFTLTQQSE